PALYPDHTLREAGLMMQQNDLGALPVVDRIGKLVGLLERDKLADRYLAELQLPKWVDLRLELLNRTLEGDLVVGYEEVVIRGRVWIATFDEKDANACVSPGDLVIVGNQPEVQVAAVMAGAGCLVVTNGSFVLDGLRDEARRRGTVIIHTGQTTFAAALLIQQSMPVQTAMDTHPPTILGEDLITDGLERLRRHNLAGLPVVDEKGFLKGLLLRRHLAGQSRRRIILTDHNHPDQAAAGVSQSEILEIIDHHNLGGLNTLEPLRMLVEPVGSSCSLIAELYRRHEAPLTAALAGAMLGAILSDTVEFRSPTTTSRDREIAAWLAEIAGEKITDLARSLFGARMPTPAPPPSWWVHHDWKIYRFGDKEIGIGQTELTDIEKSMPPVEELRCELQKAAENSGLFMAVLMLTDILEEKSLVLVHDDNGLDLAANAFNKPVNMAGMIELPGVMSRKKQLVPPLATMFTSG
ncbi:MAG: putative manganese-dependent inorganic diphosphatase, partial [Gammaproteobacteria bacterium]